MGCETSRNYNNFSIKLHLINFDKRYKSYDYEKSKVYSNYKSWNLSLGDHIPMLCLNKYIRETDSGILV
jgi:hypothetical protein